MVNVESLSHQCDLSSPKSARQAIRSGSFSGQTSQLAKGFTQGNLVILPERLAFDFMRYCQRNPKPCPLVGVSDTGNPKLPFLGDDIDIRTDIPSYNVYRNGNLSDQVSDIKSLWEDDFVAFIIGCSFSFEQAMVDEGIVLQHWERELTVSMYITSIETEPAGPFMGGMVVSMRPLTTRDAIRAVEVTSRFPHTHGAPVHLGDPSLIGIQDISRPDWGDAQTFSEGEIPVFWACGVTPQNALTNACPELCITHTPGSMLVTDLPSQFDSKLIR